MDELDVIAKQQVIYDSALTRYLLLKLSITFITKRKKSHLLIQLRHKMCNLKSQTDRPTYTLKLPKLCSSK